jgi:hypothetical protein
MTPETRADLERCLLEHALRAVAASFRASWAMSRLDYNAVARHLDDRRDNALTAKLAALTLADEDI